MAKAFCLHMTTTKMNTGNTEKSRSVSCLLRTETLSGTTHGTFSAGKTVTQWLSLKDFYLTDEL